MRRRPKVQVLLRPGAVTPGAPLDVEVRFTSASRTPYERVRVSLQCEEWSLLTPDGEGATRHPAALEGRWPAGEFTPGEHVFRARFTVPRDAPPGYAGRWWRVRWELRVEVSIPWWPDLDRRYLVTVLPPPPPFERRVPPVFTSRATGSVGVEAWAECALDATTVRPGEVLSGALSVGNVAAARVTGVDLAFVASESAPHPGARAYEVARYALSIADAAPPEGEPVRFRVRVPEALAPSCEGAMGALRWHVEAQVRRGVFAREALLAIPIVVTPDDGVARDAPRPLSPVGNTRRAQAWKRQAESYGLTWDPAAEVVRARRGEVSLAIAFEATAQGPRAALRFTWPSVGLGLVEGDGGWIERARGGRARVAYEGPCALVARGREEAQLRAFLDPAGRAVTSGFAVESLRDDGAALTRDGAAIDDHEVGALFAGASALLDAFNEGHAAVPVPAAARGAEAAWRDLARRAMGRFEPGRVRVHDGRWGQERFSAGLRWRDDGACDGAEVTVGLDPLPEGAELEGVPEALRPARDRLRSRGALTLTLDALSWRGDALIAEPSEIEDLVDAMARLSRALQGRREAAPFR